MTKIKVQDLKDLIRELRDEESYPINAVVRIDMDNYKLELTSDLHELHDDEMEIGRACDISEYFGVDWSTTLTENLKMINKDVTEGLSITVGQDIKDYNDKIAEEEALEAEYSNL